MHDKAFKEHLPVLQKMEVNEMSIIERFCGIDVHRDLLVVTILNDKSKETKRFVNDQDDINNLKN